MGLSGKCGMNVKSQKKIRIIELKVSLNKIKKIHFNIISLTIFIPYLPDSSMLQKINKLKINIKFILSLIALKLK